MSIPFRNPIVHDQNPSSFPSPFEMTDAALAQYKVERENFGSTEIILPTNQSFRVKDSQYRLPDGSVGMYFIPVNDNGSVTDEKGEEKKGYYLIDAFLREKMQLSDEDPIYALINFLHPEQNKGTLKELLMAPESVKVEMGFTHLGAYYGRGYTTNAPMLYHSHVFGVDGYFDGSKFGYPCNAQILSLDGVEQATLNKNLRYVDTCLNSGVMFPNSSPDAYKDSKFRPININTALMFYRDWIRYELYLRTDNTWYTYCAAHKTVVATVALNLPHNETSFKEVYGEQEGATLYAQFILFYNSVIGPDPGFLPADETYFEPLWKKENLTTEQIAPFTIEEYKGYEKAWLAGDLKNFTGKTPLPVDKGTAWAPQTSAEIIYDIVQTYADMLDVGSVISSATILGFMDIIDVRMGISKLNYLLHAMPIVGHLMMADAEMNAAKNPDNYLKNTFEELFMAFGGQPGKAPALSAALIELKAIIGEDEKAKAHVAGNLMPELIAAWALFDVVLHWESILKAGALSPEVAYEKLMKSIQGEMQAARDLHITEPDKVEFYAPPATAHLISTGMYRTNKYVNVQGVCTVVDSAEVHLKNNATQS